MTPANDPLLTILPDQSHSETHVKVSWNQKSLDAKYHMVFPSSAKHFYQFLRSNYLLMSTEIGKIYPQLGSTSNLLLNLYFGWSSL